MVTPVVFEEFLLEDLGIPVPLLIEVLGDVAELPGQAFRGVRDGPVDLDVEMGEAVPAVLSVAVFTLDEQAVVDVQELF